MPVSVHRRPAWRGLPWLLAFIALVALTFLTVLAAMAATLRDAVVTVVALGLWELWLAALISDWNELRSLLPPARLGAPAWQGLLKVFAYGLAGLFVAGIIMGAGESGAQQAARLQWEEGAVPQAFVLTPLPAPKIASLVPPAPPAAAKVEKPLPGPPLLLPMQGPPLAAAMAERQREAAAATAAKAGAAQAAAAAPPAPGSAPPAAQSPPPAQPAGAATQSPNASPCFGRIKGVVAADGRRFYIVPGSMQFLNYSASQWFCSEADARKAGFQPGP